MLIPNYPESGLCVSPRSGVHARTAGFARRLRVRRSMWDLRWPWVVHPTPPPEPRSLPSLETSDTRRLSVLPLAWHLGLVLLVGLSACGSPSPDGPVLGHSAGSAAAVVSPPVADAPRADLTAPHAPTPDTRLIQGADASRATSPPPDARAQTAANQAQRESPDATVRLQTLEVWAQQPGTEIDPLTQVLVDEDEDVRAQELLAEQPDDEIDPLTQVLVDEDEDVRAQELLAEQLTQEVEADAP